MSAFDLPTWLANDAAKIKSKPGLSAMHERVTLAAEALDRILAQHAGCKPGLCPTIDAYRRVLREHGYRGEVRWGDIKPGDPESGEGDA